MGKFSPHSPDGVVLRQDEPIIRLDSSGIDVFQRAKAAIGVGIRTLLRRAHLSAADLSRVCVCGAFGQFLDIPNAQALGLLPPLPAGRIELCGNTALRGCESLLLSPTAQADLSSVRRQASIVNLALIPDFDSLFLECLYLRPLETNDL